MKPSTPECKQVKQQDAPGWMFSKVSHSCLAFFSSASSFSSVEKITHQVKLKSTSLVSPFCHIVLLNLTKSGPFPIFFVTAEPVKTASVLLWDKLSLLHELLSAPAWFLGNKWIHTERGWNKARGCVLPAGWSLSPPAARVCRRPFCFSAEIWTFNTDYMTWKVSPDV